MGIIEPGVGRRCPQVIASGGSQKGHRYFRHGSRLAWLIDLKRRSVTSVTPDTSTTAVALNSVITGGKVLPKFKFRPSDVFARMS